MTILTDTSLNGDGNLLAYYKFETGALTTDSSGNSRTLTNNNSVGETANGKYSYAADFGATNTNKDFTRAEDIWNNGAFSAACWLKRNSASDTNGISQVSDSSANKQLLFGVNSSGYPYASTFRVGVGYDTITGSSAVNNDTEWHHYAFTLTTGAGGTLKVYEDGVEVGSGSVTNASGSTAQGNSYWIGYADGQRIKGYLDDFAFFSDVLTQPEIAELAANPPSGVNPIFFSSGGLGVS